MLERDRARRFATMAEVIAALGPFAMPGGLGAAVAEKMSLGGTGARGRTVALAAKYTVPMAGAPSFDRPQSGSSSLAPRSLAPPPTAPAVTLGVPVRSSSAAGVSPLALASPDRRSRTLLVLAILLGLLGAAGVVLVALTIARRGAAVPTAADAPRSAIVPATDAAASATAPRSDVAAPRLAPSGAPSMAPATTPQPTTSARHGVAPTPPKPATSASNGTPALL
jgi:hypothetical protein